MKKVITIAGSNSQNSINRKLLTYASDLLEHVEDVILNRRDDATERLLENKKGPSRKAGELDNRGSHFYLALYWAEALVAQTIDTDLSAEFVPLAKQLAENETKIVSELNDIQGNPVDIGGYYEPKEDLINKAMRPSATLNSVLS